MKQPSVEDWRRAKEFARGITPIAYICPEKCGCLWRDNHDGTMSLFGPNSKSCKTCEILPLDKLTAVYADAPPLLHQTIEEYRQVIAANEAYCLLLTTVLEAANALIRDLPDGEYKGLSELRIAIRNAT